MSLCDWPHIRGLSVSSHVQLTTNTAGGVCGLACRKYSIMRHAQISASREDDASSNKYLA